MGNSASQQSEVESFYDTFNQPITYKQDDVDQESESLVNQKEHLKCVQCGARFTGVRLLYSTHSVCRQCMDRLKGKGVWGRSNRFSVEYRGRYVDERFPQSVAWNFGSAPASKARNTSSKMSNVSSGDVILRRRSDSEINRTYKHKPMALTKREILDRVYNIEEVDVVTNVEEGDPTARRAITQRRHAVIVAPAYFKMLTNGQFKQHSYQQIYSRPFGFCLIGGNLWCAHENEITAWTTSFKPVEFDERDKYQIKYGVMTELQALAQMKSGKIVVASGSGLHLLETSGRYDGRIATGVFTDVAVQEHTVYACIFGGHVKAKLEIYDETIPWALLKTVTLPCDGLFTVHVSEAMISVCNAAHGGLYILDINGKLLQKCALKRKHGGVGQFHEPRICHGGFDGSIMVVDRENGYVQVRTVNGDWGMVQLEIPVQKPACALFYKKQLFIAQSSPPYRIYKYM